MNESREGLRSRARRFENREHPTMTRYSEEFRREVLAIARERRALGVPIGRIAAEVGVKSRTLALWLRDRKVTVPKRQLRRVNVTPEVAVLSPGGSALTVSIGAVRIEGLDVEGVVRLVQALAA